ncbi:unnamed protein product [Tilletia controversa]|nr:unnamed protein product [Tilletia controversa]
MADQQQDQQREKDAPPDVQQQARSSQPLASLAVSTASGPASAILQRPGLAHTTSYNSQLDVLLRGAALQVQDRALVADHRRRKRSETSTAAHEDSSTDDDHDHDREDDDDDSESDASDALYPEYGSDAAHTEALARSKKHGDNAGDDDEDDLSSVTSADTATTAGGPVLGFDPALTASTSTSGPGSGGPLRTRIVPNLSIASESAAMTGASGPNNGREPAEDDQLDTPTLNRPHNDRLERGPVRSWSGSLAPEGVADRALEEAATLYALVSAPSTTSLTRRRPRYRTMSTATLRNSGTKGPATALPAVHATTPTRESPNSPLRVQPMIPGSGPMNTREYALVSVLTTVSSPPTFDVVPDPNPYFAPGTLTTHHWISATAALSTVDRDTLATIPDADDESDDDDTSTHSDSDSDPDILTLRPAGVLNTVPSVAQLTPSPNNLLIRPYLSRTTSNQTASPLTPNSSTVFELYDSHLHLDSPHIQSGADTGSTGGVDVPQSFGLRWTNSPPVSTPDEYFSADIPESTADGKWDPSSSPSFPPSANAARHPAHSHAHLDSPSSHSANLQRGRGDPAEHASHPHYRGLSLLDEDDQLATHLDATALDTLADAGEEEEEDLRAERQRRRTTSLLHPEDAPSKTSLDTPGSQPSAAKAAQGKKSAQAGTDTEGADKDATTTTRVKPEPSRGDTDATVRSGSSLDDDDAAFLAAVNQRLDPAAKLRALREEFGPSRVRYSSATKSNDADAGEEEDEEEEVFIGSATSVLFRTVLIRGSLIVTNHRVCFFAMLPPPLGTTASAQPSPAGSLPSASDTGARSGFLQPGNGASGAQGQQPSTPGIPTDPALSNPILIKGPATLHRTGWRRKRRCWFELRANEFCAYPSSEQLYQPIGSIRLQDIEEIFPADFKRVTWLSVKVVGQKTASLEFNTEAACLAWRRELEAALWAYRNSSDKVRISIPLARIAGVERIGMLHFAITSTIRVFDHEPTNGKGRDATRTSKTRDVSFGLMKRNAALMDKLLVQVQGLAKWRDELGFEEAMRRTPVPIIEVEGSRMQDEHDDDNTDEGDKPSDKSATSGAGIVDGSQKAPAAATSSTTSSAAMEKTSSESSVKSSNETPEEAAARTKQLTRAQQFIDQFVLKARPEEMTLYKADIVRTIPSAGTLAVSTHFLCFWRRRLGSLPDIRLKIPVSDLVGASTSRAFRWHVWGLSLHIRGHADLPFEFHDQSLRDRALEQIEALIQTIEKDKQAKTEAEAGDRQVGARGTADAGDISSRRASEGPALPLVASETAASSGAGRHPQRQDSEMARSTFMDDNQDDEVLLDRAVINYIPKMINEPPEHMLKVPPMNIFCLTIGSRGDVQPYISLGKALQGHGHRVTIVSHPEYEDWVRGHGIDYRPVGGDPGKLMQLSVEHRILSPSFFRESIGKFRDWLDELLRESWEQCQGADLLIESPSTMSGIHVAEGLGIPYFRAFTMPWTPTSAYPQAFSVPPFEMGPSYNALSYALFDSIMWRATSGQINRWRKHMMGLKATDSSELAINQVPFIYNFSEAVVPFPNDWGSRICISGYWFLDTGSGEWDPPEDLVAFLDKARDDDKKVAYIGFGSITVPDPVALTKNIYAAVKAAGVRAVVSKGWSARMYKGKGKDEEPVPPECYVVDSIPHDWLFPRIDIAMHHGGAGTTGASLRAGLVTLIKPFFGDQYMWALRVQKLGAGARVGGLDSHDISDALKKAAEDRVMVEKAQEVGRKIRSENGPHVAISFIYQNLNVAQRTRHERVPTRSWTANLIRTDTAASGAQSEHEDVLSDEGDGGEEKVASQRRRSLKMVKSPFTSSSTGRLSRASVTTPGSTTTKGTLPTSPPATDGPTLGENEDPKVGHSLTKSSSTFARLQTLPSISMPTIPIPNVIKDLVGADSVKSPGEASNATKSTLGTDTDASASGAKASSKPVPSASKTEDSPKKPSPRTYKGLKAEDRRRAELMAARMKQELENGATSFEAAQRQAKLAAVDAAERVRAADAEAEKEKEEKERKARTKSSHGLSSFVTHPGRKSIDLSGIWPSVTNGIGVGASSSSSNPAAASASESTDSGSASSKDRTVSARTAKGAAKSPLSTPTIPVAELEGEGRPAGLERRATDGSKITDGTKPSRRLSLRAVARGCRSSASTAKTSLDVNRDATIMAVAHSAPVTPAPPTPASFDGLELATPPVGSVDSSAKTLRPTDGAGAVKPIGGEEGPLGEPLTMVESPMPIDR